ncbi:PfkB family carbohydrate kinase [Umezawaea beigongshangensis]|uniref:PfkB family carbohydrate kinase n=1 Tax=Umezawaea beigongshangensis TaxID=2780383 RepID=UPI0018F15E24|nr:PfkB family carbohydrate kinase [Umezawaea beigongshangensis]
MTQHVVVLAPSPQLTVTVEELEGQPDIHLHAGGQGIWQARMITSLGVPVVLCATFGGETGGVLRGLVTGPDIDVRSRDVRARNGAYVHDRRDGGRTPVVTAHADSLSRHEVDDLYEMTLVEGLRAGIAVLSAPTEDGVLPSSVYRRLTADLTSHDCRVVVDLSGERLDAALEGGPTVVKVSHEELVDDGRAENDELPALIGAARKIADSGVRAVIVSRAAEATLALVGDRTFLIESPALQTVDTKGGGDSMTAGVVAALAQGEEIEDALTLGAAAGAINVTRHGLGTGSGETIRALRDHVTLREIGPDGTESTS